MVTNLKDLEKLLKLLRKQGVTEFICADVTLKLGELPAQPKGSIEFHEGAEDPADPWASFPEGELTNEQLAFYSSGGQPGTEPEGLLTDEDKQGKA